MQRALAGIALLLVVSAAAGCGKKGEVSSELRSRFMSRPIRSVHPVAILAHAYGIADL
jgi:hypothetical protein